MSPLFLKPVLKQARWGGCQLASLFGKPVGHQANVAESWEVVDRGPIQSIVENGSEAGATLRQLVDDRRGSLLGRHAHHSTFPLLVKLLDAADRLSVQVHPTCEQALEMQLSDSGKTEAWVIIEAAPQSRLYVGLRPGVDKPALQSAIRSNAIEECLHSFEVGPGDCISVPAGTVHAIGEGIVLAEVQQSSDLTFRLFDWGRLDSSGAARPLHVAQALQCIDFERGPVAPVVPRPIVSAADRSEELVACTHFVMHRHHLRVPFATAHDNRCHILLLLEGSADIRWDNHSEHLRRGGTVLVPAEHEETWIHPVETCTLLDVFVS